ncbi:hypothetical protein BGW41_002062 [Actinomortierella wolfii]|nr:hypothetical protein BGW41_002062 [Actinomortierella wolfii]
MPLVTPNQAVEMALKQDGVIPDGTSAEPQVTFMPDSPTDKYTLIFVDPDAPSRIAPTNREWRHWVVSNISVGSSSSLTSVHNGTTLTRYQGPAPPPGTDFHRYVFLLYKQTPNSDATLLSTPLSGNRGRFKATQFANQAGLELVGANYFFAKAE